MLPRAGGEWVCHRHQGRHRPFPDEFGSAQPHIEGAVRAVSVNRYERDPEARKKAIQHYGPRCLVCDLDFKRDYGANWGWVYPCPPHGSPFGDQNCLRDRPDPRPADGLPELPCDAAQEGTAVCRRGVEGDAREAAERWDVSFPTPLGCFCHWCFGQCKKTKITERRCPSRVV